MVFGLNAEYCLSNIIPNNGPRACLSGENPPLETYQYQNQLFQRQCQYTHCLQNSPREVTVYKDFCFHIKPFPCPLVEFFLTAVSVCFNRQCPGAAEQYGKFSEQRTGDRNPLRLRILKKTTLSIYKISH